MIQASLPQASPRRELIGQLIRFGLVGLGSTLLYAAVYWPLATYVMWPVLAVVIAFAVAVTAGFFLHSRWSFKGHERTEDKRTKAQFFAVQTVGMLMNAAFTWVAVDWLHGPTWWPLIPAVLITPIVTFALNRWWVFG
jgi:putative flippase GtrA